MEGPTSVADRARNFWTAQAPKGDESRRNLREAAIDLTTRGVMLQFVTGMHVIAGKKLTAYASDHQDAGPWLVTFFERAEAARWLSMADVRRVYPHANAVIVASGAVVIVFNACGNKYRLITAIHFNRGNVYILRFMTHAEYDKGLWKNQL